MLSSKRHVSTARKKLQEDEKTKKKATGKEEEKTKYLTKNQKAEKRTTTTTSKTVAANQKTQLKRPPLTPPSSRVTKTQYFSSKSTTSTGSSSKSLNKKSVESSKTTRQTINPRTGVKDFIKKVREENKKKITITSSETKRPGTATLKNPVVLKNIETPTTNTIDYEDDFDSYESDFEVYTSETSSSTEAIQNFSSSTSDSEEKPVIIEDKRINSAGNDEERKLDSGAFDLTEQKYKQVLHNIKESVENEKEKFSDSSSSNNVNSLPDEGFEEVKSLSGENSCFINFSSAQKKLKQSKIEAKQRKRGEEILNMIKLDSYNFTLLDLAPMTYERYIKLYGQQNAVQASAQTGDDDVHEECQTDKIIKHDKWTQAPIQFSNFNVSQPNYLKVYKQEFLGVGSGELGENNAEINFNIKNILKAAQMLVTLLQENYNNSFKNMQNSELPDLSIGYIECNTTIPLLKDTLVTHVAYNTNIPSLFLTVHEQKMKLEKQSFLCTWYLSNLDQPENIFVSYSKITCSCVHGKFIISGSDDGTISVWSSKQNDKQIPQYISEVGVGHVGEIISINCNEFDTTHQFCSCDCNGTILFWSIISNHNETITLIQINKISLQQNNTQTTDMLINQLDTNNLFVATHYNHVIHILANNARPHPKKYCSQSLVTCMAACPFSESYFLTGLQNGCVALYNRIFEKPLIIMGSNNASESKIEQIEWSRSKPCVFYVKHENIIDIWDLTLSDMLPVSSILFKKQLQYFKLIDTKENSNNINKSCMILGFTDGDLQLHILSKEHAQNSIEDIKQDIKKFFKYVNRL